MVAGDIVIHGISYAIRIFDTDGIRLGRGTITGDFFKLIASRSAAAKLHLRDGQIVNVMLSRIILNEMRADISTNGPIPGFCFSLRAPRLSGPLQPRVSARNNPFKGEFPLHKSFVGGAMIIYQFYKRFDGPSENVKDWWELVVNEATGAEAVQHTWYHVHPDLTGKQGKSIYSLAKFWASAAPGEVKQALKVQLLQIGKDPDS